MTTAESLARKLPGAKKTSKGWTARCPAHSDKAPSLDITTKNGKVVFRCRAGCDQKDVLTALKAMGAWESAKPNGKACGGGFNWKGGAWREAKRWNWTDENGVLLMQTRRHERPRKDGGKPEKKYSQHRPDPNRKGAWIDNLDGVRRVPLELPRVIETAAKGGLIFIVEGEPKVDVIASFGWTATCCAAGSSSWKAEFAPCLKGADIVILPDNDKAGFGYAAKVAESLEGVAAKVRILELPDLPEKGDIVDWVKADPVKHNAARLQELLETLGRDWKEWAADHKAAAAASSHWRSKLRTTSDGVLYASAANVSIELMHDPVWGGVFFYDAFQQMLMLSKPIPQRAGEDKEAILPRPWKDSDTSAVLVYFQLGDYPRLRLDAVDIAIIGVAERTLSVHPVQDYLNSLKWDGAPRLDEWLVTYCGVMIESNEHAQYIHSVGAKWMISAVARILQPGCQADCMLVLESAQGLRKSSLFRVLAIRDDWFSDSIPPDLGSKDAADHVRGIWIAELAELSQIRKSTVESLKAFISRRVERFRAAYGRHKIVYPRQCVFAGSTNSDRYLADSTGNRRFWPVKVGKIDIAAVERDRDQLWAEAVHRFRRDEAWWLDDEMLDAIAAQEQANRYQGDPWEPMVVEYLSQPAVGDTVTVGEILLKGIGVEAVRQGRADQNRVIDILKSLGWGRGRRTMHAKPWVRPTSNGHDQ